MAYERLAKDSVIRPVGVFEDGSIKWGGLVTGV